MSISEAELNAVTAELDAWAHKSVAGFDALAEAHRVASQSLKENIGALAQQQVDLDDALSRRTAAAKEAQRLGAQLSAQLEQLHVEAARLPAKRADLEAVIDKEAQSLESLKHTIAEQEAAGERRDAELAKGTSMFKRWLGLAFVRVDDNRLRLTFTHVDPSHPARPFSFEVFVDPDNEYHVEKCSPELAGLGALVGRLNESNNFAEFVRTVRRKFQEAVPGREGAPRVVTQP